MVMGCEVGAEIARALGFRPDMLSKIVIVIEADSPVEVFVRGFVDEDSFRKAAESFAVRRVEGVTVADDCTVVVKE